MPPRQKEKSMSVARYWLGLCALAAVIPALAAPLEGIKTVTAITRDQSTVQIGTVRFTPMDGGRTRFELVMDHTKLQDHFLSMKEFKCLNSPDEVVCHVPYPYAQPGVITEGDSAWLEHSLLFLFKKPGEFGAKLWNGLYFKLERTDGGFVGRPQSIDLNLISAPPAQLDVPPYRPALRSDISSNKGWIQSIRID
jgi:hypothetical protein